MRYTTALYRFIAILSSTLLLYNAYVVNPNYVLAASPRMELSVKSSPGAEHATVKQLNGAEMLKGALKLSRTIAPASDLYVTIHQDTGSSVYTMDKTGNLHSVGGEMLVLRPTVRSKLLKEAQTLRAKHYGKLLPWHEAKLIIPRKAYLKVVDLETGLAFNAQRRAGSSHADVQPLTIADTQIMKQIYDGAWSWHRRAILVEANGRMLAASMHGMPHGGDGIPDNGFSGHFCIHFQGSTTHGKGNVDLGHQLMIAKASGTLDRFVTEFDPYDTINAFFLANEYGDSGLMHRLFPGSAHPQANMRHFGVEEGAVRYRFLQGEDHTEQQLAIDIEVETCLARAARCSSKSVHVFHMRRMSQVEPWLIDEIK